MDNFDYKKYLAEGKLLKEEVYKQLGREDLLESVDMDDLKNAKEKLSNPHTILDIIYDKTISLLDLIMKINMFLVKCGIEVLIMLTYAMITIKI